MPTTDPTRTCPALHVLNGTLGTRDGQPLTPEHRPPLGDDWTRCGHCGATPPQDKP